MIASAYSSSAIVRISTLEYDEGANALYLRFSFAVIDDTIPLSDSVYVDVDAEGDPVGIEILHATPGELPNIELLGKAVALRELVTSVRQ